MLLYKREVLGGDPHLWIPMEPYRGGGALKASAPLEIPTINPAARSASVPNPRRLGLPMPARVGAVSRIRPVRQLTRTPQFFERVRGQIGYGLPEIQRAVARVEAAGGRVTDADRQAIEDGSLLEECLQNAAAANVIVQDFNSPSWRILMEQRRLVVGRAVNNVRFVISDHPVLYCPSVPGSGGAQGRGFWTR